MHTHGLRVDGYTHEEIQKIRNLDRSFVTDDEYRIYQYAIKSLSDPKSISDDEFWSLKEELKLSDRKILEIQEAIAMAIELSVFVDSLDVPLEPWYYEIIK
jgi:hypothetical protein